MCRQSLVNAADTLKSKNPPSSVLDGQLFLVRHILILKEITQNLDFASRDPERIVDFSGVTGACRAPSCPAEADPRVDTLATILGKTTSLLPNALFASLGMPREESLTDVKHVSSPPFPF